MHSSYPPPSQPPSPYGQPWGHPGQAPWPPAPLPPRRPRGAAGLVIAIAAVVAVVVLSALGGVAYYGVKRYEERSKQAAEEKERAEKKLLPTSTFDATSDLVDDDFRLRLKWPGKGFKMLRQEDARHILPDTLAGIMNEAGCQLMVIGDYSPGADMVLIAKAGLATIPGTHLSETEPAKVRVLGRDAVRFEVETDLMGLRFQQVHHVIEREGWYFRFAEMRRPDAKCRLPSLDELVVLEPGQVRGRNLAGIAPDQERPQYRVRGSTFESVVHRFRVTAPQGSHLLVGMSVAEQDQQAAVLVAATGVSLWLGSMPPPPVDLETFKRKWVDATAEAAGAPAIAVSVEGKRGNLDAAITNGPAPFETMWAFELAEGRLFVYRLVYAPSLREDARLHLQRTRDTVEALDDAASAELARSLPRTDVARGVGPDRAVRGGRFIHFPSGFTMPLPASAYLPQVTDRRGPEIALSFARPAWGVDSALVLLARELDVRRAQLTVAAKLTGIPEADLVVVPGADLGGARRGRVSYFVGGIAYTIDILSISGPNHAAHIATSGPESWVDAAGAETAAFVERAAFGAPIQDLVVGGNTIKTARLGFELNLPSDQWTFEPIKLSENQWFTAYAAMSRRGAVFVFSVGLDEAEADFTGQVLEQHLIAQFVKGADVPERKEAKLGGLRAKRITVSSKQDAILANAGGTLFFLVVDANTPGGIDPEAVYGGFRILD